MSAESEAVELLKISIPVGLVDRVAWASMQTMREVTVGDYSADGPWSAAPELARDRYRAVARRAIAETLMTMINAGWLMRPPAAPSPPPVPECQA